MVSRNKIMNDHQAEQFEPAAEQVITRLETLKVFSDPLRSRILDLLRTDPSTVKRLAAELNVSPKKLYYHVNLLEQHELIRVVSTRVVSGIIEKQYRAGAYLFLFDKSLLVGTASAEEALDATIAMMFDTTRIQLEHGIESGVVDTSDDAPIERSLLLNWNLSRMPPEQAEAFYKRLRDLLEEFHAFGFDDKDSDAQAYRLFVSLFPVRRPPARSAPKTTSSS
jgi:DNA-binding transcriptional ArsR family regulator